MAGRVRILAADDDRIVRRLLSVNLERWGYEVVLATNGTEAWELLQQDDAPQIVVLDWVMPGMDGIEICRRLRARTDRRYHYVLLLSGKQKKSDLIEAFEAGADDYLTKPLHLRELELRLSAAIRAVESRRRPSDLPAAHAAEASALGPKPTRSSEEPGFAPQSPSDASLAGSVIASKWRVTRPIAGGGMGTVWEGEHTSLGTRVAIKFIRAEYAENGDAVARFAEEARTTAQIQSRHAVKVFDYGVTPGGLPYLVMEFLEGLSITDHVTEHGPMPVEQAAVIIAQTAQALGRAHVAGIIHRDVKPDNIMLVPDDEAPPNEPRRMAKLVDFGVAKVLAGNAVTGNAMRRATAAGMIVGTPSFMSPEQLLGTGEADQHADLWGLAVSAYVAVTAQLPYDGRNLGELVNQICLHPAPVPSDAQPGVPRTFDDWFARACAGNVSERYADAFVMAQALLAACGPRPRLAPEATSLPAPFARVSAPRISVADDCVTRPMDRATLALRPATPAPVIAAQPSARPAPRMSARPSRAPARQSARMALTFALGVVVAVGAMLAIR